MQALLNFFSPSFFWSPFSFGVAFFSFFAPLCLLRYLVFIFFYNNRMCRKTSAHRSSTFNDQATNLLFLDAQNLSANQSKTRMRG